MSGRPVSRYLRAQAVADYVPTTDKEVIIEG